jgi:archaeosine synthase beta-subunit
MPATPAQDSFVADRSARPPHDPWADPSITVDDEAQPDGVSSRVGTVFLTGRECPWRCVMCDLWRQSTADDTPAGAIPHQIGRARQAFASGGHGITQIKLYNAGSFFDPRAVPEEDYDGVAALVGDLDAVIVESHPTLVGDRVERFASALRGRGSRPPRLEVALGLETAHPEALGRLNKQMTVGGFERAAARLRGWGADVRVFLIVSPPFVPAAEQDAWLTRSIVVAAAAGATAVALIPLRRGTNALERLLADDLARIPTLADLERSTALALEQARDIGGGLRVFADLWNLVALAGCPACRASHVDRLRTMNLTQRIPAPVSCEQCELARPG